jgi:hypothetical protein
MARILSANVLFFQLHEKVFYFVICYSFSEVFAIAHYNIDGEVSHVLDTYAGWVHRICGLCHHSKYAIMQLSYCAVLFVLCAGCESSCVYAVVTSLLSLRSRPSAFTTLTHARVSFPAMCAAVHLLPEKCDAQFNPYPANVENRVSS